MTGVMIDNLQEISAGAVVYIINSGHKSAEVETESGFERGDDYVIDPSVADNFPLRRNFEPWNVGASSVQGKRE